MLRYWGRSPGWRRCLSQFCCCGRTPFGPYTSVLAVGSLGWTVRYSGSGVDMGEQPIAFGARLRWLRKEVGLSPAKRAHYSQGYPGKIEAGDKPAGQELALRCDTELGARGALARWRVQPPVRELLSAPT